MNVCIFIGVEILNYKSNVWRWYICGLLGMIINEYMHIYCISNNRQWYGEWLWMWSAVWLKLICDGMGIIINKYPKKYDMCI